MLYGPRDEQRLVVLGVWADGRKFDLSRAAAFSEFADDVKLLRSQVARCREILGKLSALPAGLALVLLVLCFRPRRLRWTKLSRTSGT